jgi:transposase
MKLARCVVMSHDIVVYEDLQVRNLVRNHHLAKSMYDSSWGLFTRWLDYYGKVFDKVVIAVPPTPAKTALAVAIGCRKLSLLVPTNAPAVG